MYFVAGLPNSLPLHVASCFYKCLWNNVTLYSIWLHSRGGSAVIAQSSSGLLYRFPLFLSELIDLENIVKNVAYFFGCNEWA